MSARKTSKTSTKKKSEKAAKPKARKGVGKQKKQSAKKKSSPKKASKKSTDKKQKKKPVVKIKRKGEKRAEKPEVVQPEVNIGLVGHVDHGKTTLTEKLSGKWTDTHSEELKRGITIRLGYADAVFRKCPKCRGDSAFTVNKECAEHKVPTKSLRKVSFVDAPGHESLMATMLSGATIMDGALLLIAANEPCPQPQTKEHLMALKITGVKNLVVVQNKIDVVSEERALRNYKEIKDFLKGTDYAEAPVIPISAQHGVNIDVLIRAIEETIPTPERDASADPMLLVARSFDINKPGLNPKDLRGGVIGGAIVRGRLKVGDKIEIGPGRVVEEQNKTVAKPINTRIVSAMTGGNQVDSLGPGGSVAVQTSLDPSIVHSDSLTGNVVGLPGKLPRTWYELLLKVHLLERVVGSQEELGVEPVKMNEMLLLNVNGGKSIGFVYELGKNMAKCRLKMPLCAEPGDKVTISRRIGTRFRLIGYADIHDDD